MRSNFGKYDVPPTLQTLIELEKSIRDSEQFYYGLKFYITLDDDYRYFNTPCDVVVFGNIGVDGIHYGFLTDYSTAINLEVAPIVCVSPMDFDRPTRIVAKNIREFLRVNLTDGELFYNTFNSEADYLATRQKWDEEEANSPYQPSESDRKVRSEIINKLLNDIHIPTINNPYHYVQSLELERQKLITIPTQDRLGVTTQIPHGEQHIPFHVHQDTHLDLALLKEYLNSAPFASRLALFRDIQQNFVLHQEQELRVIVIEAMMRMELADEAERISEEP